MRQKQSKKVLSNIFAHFTRLFLHYFGDTGTNNPTSLKDASEDNQYIVVRYGWSKVDWKTCVWQ